MEKIRTFIAVRLPEDIRHRVAELSGRLKESGADVKWVPEENLHITIKFIGAVEPVRLSALAAAVGKAAEGVAPFSVSIGGAGAFPKIIRPSVVWVGVTSGAEELAALAGRVESFAEEAGFPREERKFSPHITVGRVKTPAGMQKLSASLEQFKFVEAGSFTIGTVSVMKSQLTPPGPVYSVMAEYELGA
jgi:2'-5' RNA ligase